jgi:hypothetical protein
MCVIFCTLIWNFKGWNSSFSVVTRIRVGRPRNRDLVPAVGIYFIFIFIYDMQCAIETCRSSESVLM